MNVTEAVDLLSIAARSSTWDARPADAAALLEVVRRQEAEVERMGLELADRYDAKQEVQNLRAEVERLKDGTLAVSLIVRLKEAEVERLTTEREVRQRYGDRMKDERDEARAEVERLKAEHAKREGPESLAAIVRDIAARQREACAVEAEDYVIDADLCGVPCRDEVSAIGVHLRTTPLVTDGPVAHEGSPTVMGGTTPGGIILPDERRHDVKSDESAAVTYDGNVSAVSPRFAGFLSGTPRGLELDAAVREQPAPKPGGEAVWPSLLASGLVPESLRADCEARHRLGVERYGRALETGNGRDALADAYQEALDLAVYLWQAHLEGGRDGSCFRPLTKDVIAVAAYIKGAMR